MYVMYSYFLLVYIVQLLLIGHETETICNSNIQLGNYNNHQLLLPYQNANNFSPNNQTIIAIIYH